MAKRLDYETWREQMRQEGVILGKQEDILTVLRARFGTVLPDLEQRIAAILSPKELDALLVRASTARDLDEVRAALSDGQAGRG